MSEHGRRIFSSNVRNKSKILPSGSAHLIIYNNITMAPSDHESELSEVSTILTTPFSIATKSSIS